MTDYLICPSCGWVSLPSSATTRKHAYPACGKPLCSGHGAPLRQATEEEVAALPDLAALSPAQVDVRLEDSERFYGVPDGDFVEIFDSRINSDSPKSLIWRCPEAEIQMITENLLLGLTPCRPVDVVICAKIDMPGLKLSNLAEGLLKQAAARKNVEPEQLPRDNADLVQVVRMLGVQARLSWQPLAVVTIPASWCAGDSPAHEAGWYIDACGESEEVLPVGPRLKADGTVFIPLPKMIYRG